MKKTTLMYAAAFLSVAFAGNAAQQTSIMAGDPTGANVTITQSSTDGQKSGDLVIETHKLGNPGAKISILVDRGHTPLLSKILTPADCKFNDDGAQCRLVIKRMSSAYNQIVGTFKRAKSAHIEVQNAAVMQMDQSVSLAGFTRKFRL